MPSSADVLIIGGGVIGLTTAYTLARAGARVAVLGRQDFGREAPWAGAGLLPPGYPERASGAYDPAPARTASRVTAAVTLDGREVAGHYLVCTGAWADELLATLGLRTGVRPIRGQIALLNARPPGPGRVLVHGKRYVVPRDDGRVLV